MPDSARFPAPGFAPPRIDADYWSLRLVDEVSESLTVRKNVAMPPAFAHDRGAMATVYADGGYGYAATGDTSPAGLAAALERAAALGAGERPLRAGRLPDAAARRAARRVRVAGDRRPGCRPAASGSTCCWTSRRAGIDPRIVDWDAARRGADRDASPRHQRGRRRRPALPVPDAGTRRSPRTPTATPRRARSTAIAASASRAGSRSSSASASAAPAGGSPRRRSSCWPRRTARPGRWTCCSRPTR